MAALLLFSTYVILGPTQYGKTSIINLIADKKIADIGTGNGVSVTDEYKIYTIEKSPYLSDPITFIDMQGFDDTRLVRTNDDIVEYVKKSVLEAGKKIRGIILTEAIHAPSLTMTVNLKRIYEMFGEKVKNSIIVLATYADMIPKDKNFQKKYDEIEKICKKHNIQLVKWSNKKELLTQSELEKQFGDLTAAMTKIKAFNPDWMKELEEQIENLAKKMRDEYPKPTEEEIRKLANELADKADLIKKEEIEEYEEIRTVTETTTVTEKDKLFGFITVGSNQHTTTTTKEMPVTNTRKKEVMVKPPIEAFLNDAKEQLQPPPIENFLPQAREKIFDEVSQSIKNLNFDL